MIVKHLPQPDTRRCLCGLRRERLRESHVSLARICPDMNHRVSPSSTRCYVPSIPPGLKRQISMRVFTNPDARQYNGCWSVQRLLLKVSGVYPAGVEFFSLHESFVEAWVAGRLVVVEDLAFAEHSGAALGFEHGGHLVVEQGAVGNVGGVCCEVVGAVGILF